MFLSGFILFLANVLHVFGGTEYPELNYVPSVGNDSLNKTKRDNVGLAHVLDFFNTETLTANWELVRRNLTGFCDKDLQKYIKGLGDHEQWALKMDDANGRYSTGWFWGNHYWTGSRSLCENIAPEGHSHLEQSKAEDVKNRSKRNIETPTVSPSLTKIYRHGPLEYTSVPPFPVSFFMLKISLNVTLTSEERILHIGLCMPEICTNTDVQTIMEETSRSSGKVSVRVEEVRSAHHSFVLHEDTTFQILCGVTFMVVALLAAGTAYDLHLKHKAERKKVLKINCTSYTSAEHKLGAENIKLDMPENKLKNGKCRVYVVNNNNEEEFAVAKTLNPGDESFFSDVCKELLLSFSLRTNINNICDRTVGSDTIPVLHGLKSISMAWVILGHTCIVAFKYSDNMEFRKVVQKEFLFQTISNGVFSVDTFFFTSGLLVAFLYFRTNAKGKLEKLTMKSNNFLSGCLHFLGLLSYRFARLTAPYLFVLGVVEVSMKWFNYNSIFETPTLDHVNCPKYWWRNILYLNTLFPVEDMCMLWSWYLSDDTQFYIVGAILLILATKYFKTSAVLVGAFILSSWITTGYVAFNNSHMPHLDDPLALFDKIYDKPWTRLGPYLIGMAAGWILFKTDCKIKMSKLTVALGWLSSVAVLLSLIYGLYEADLSSYAAAAYSSLSHSAWALGLAWIVIACSTGHGGYANSLLSATVLYPISRITYCTYLVHPIMIRFLPMNMDYPLHLGKEMMLIVFLGQVVASYILAFFVSIAFEAPVVSMLRILTKLGPGKKRKSNAAT